MRHNTKGSTAQNSDRDEKVTGPQTTSILEKCGHESVNIAYMDITFHVIVSITSGDC
jgi:hypothetical protein